MDGDSIDVPTIADDDPTEVVCQFGSRVLSSFEERTEHYLSAIARVSHCKASFHVGHQDMYFRIHSKQSRSDNWGDMDSWRIIGPI